MKICIDIALYASSIILGFGLVGFSLYLMRKKVLPRRKFRQSFGWMVFFVGATERFAATTLAAFAPAQLASFIAGWVALKYAVNWQKKPDNKARENSLFAIIGTVLSFAIAIGIGLAITPDNISYFVDWRNHAK